MYFKSDYIIHLYRFSLRVLKYIQLQRIRHIDTSLASLMQDMVYHHLSMSGEKNTTKSGERTKPPRGENYCTVSYPMNMV